MAFVMNKRKQKRIEELGITSDCPLFHGRDVQHLPNWIWKENKLKAEAYEKLIHLFAIQQIQYIKAMVQHGGSATDNDIRRITGMPCSTISARRSQLMELGIVDANPVKEKMGPFTVSNKIWSLNFGKLYDFFTDNYIIENE